MRRRPRRPLSQVLYTTACSMVLSLVGTIATDQLMPSLRFLGELLRGVDGGCVTATRVVLPLISTIATDQLMPSLPGCALRGVNRPEAVDREIGAGRDRRAGNARAQRGKDAAFTPELHTAARRNAPPLPGPPGRAANPCPCALPPVFPPLPPRSYGSGPATTSVSTAVFILYLTLTPSPSPPARNPEALWWILWLSLASAVVQLVISWTIKRYGAVVFATIMTTRQFFSILLSSVVFMTPLTLGQW